MAYQGITIDDIYLQINPEDYSPEDIWFGSAKRNLSGGMILVNQNKIKKRFVINALTKEQFNEINIVAALNKELDYVDGIPIAEPTNSREIYELIETDSSYIFYVPKYIVRKVGFTINFSGNKISYNLILEEV